MKIVLFLWVCLFIDWKHIGNKETMARNLKLYITRSGKSQKDLAEMVGVASSTFNDWVKGKKYPRIDKIEILANIFRIQKSDLIEDKADKKDNMDVVSVTEDERILLDLFNQVPEENRQMVLDMIKIALKKK